MASQVDKGNQPLIPQIAKSRVCRYMAFPLTWPAKYISHGTVHPFKLPTLTNGFSRACSPCFYKLFSFSSRGSLDITAHGSIYTYTKCFFGTIWIDHIEGCAIYCPHQTATVHIGNLCRLDVKLWHFSPCVLRSVTSQETYKISGKKSAFHPKIHLIESSHLQRPMLSNVSNNAGTHPLPPPTAQQRFHRQAEYIQQH